MTPLLLDINAPEFILLAVLAVILFGPEKLPEFAKKAAHVLHYIRQMAGNAQNQLKSELGPEFSNLDFRDLNPKEFVKKHLLEEVEPLVSDVKGSFDSVGSKGIFTDLEATFAEARRPPPAKLVAPALVGAAAAGRTASTPWDRDAT